MKRRIFIAASAGVTSTYLAGCGGGEDDSMSSSTAQVDERMHAMAVSTSATSAGRVVVVGGGVAGASAAKYLRLWAPTLDVTLVSRAATYDMPIMSSLILTGQRTVASLRFTYEALKSKYGVRVVIDDVVSLDPATRALRLGSGSTLTADRIVLAPGIDFDPIEGLANANSMPHAWQGGPQVVTLRDQLSAMPSNGVVVLAIPKTPFRATAAPYARACLIADWLRKHKPQGKLLLLDGNADIVAEKANFAPAFAQRYASILEYRPGVNVLAAEPGQMRLLTDGGLVPGHVFNVIPSQRAGAIARAAGLATANNGRFCPVNVLTYESTLANGVHVIGDACSTAQPKAGTMGNMQGKVCADAIARSVLGIAAHSSPVTSSSGYSPISMSEASWGLTKFQYAPPTVPGTLGAMVAAYGSPTVSQGWNQDNFEEMGTWFRALSSDIFA